MVHAQYDDCSHAAITWISVMVHEIHGIKRNARNKTSRQPLLYHGAQFHDAYFYYPYFYRTHQRKKNRRSSKEVQHHLLVLPDWIHHHDALYSMANWIYGS